MHIRQPTVRLHTRGYYFVRWGSPPVDHHLGREKATADKLFFDPASTHPGALARWQDWAARRKLQAQPSLASLSRQTIAEAMADMLRDYVLQGRHAAAKYFQLATPRFMRLHGEAELIEAATADPKRGRYAPPIVAILNAHATDLRAAKLSPKTINHTLIAVQRLFNWAHAQGRCPAVAWSGLKKLPTRRGTPQVRSLTTIRSTLTRIAKSDPDLVPWLALNYLCCLRPSEVITLVHRRGEFLPVRGPSGRIIKSDGLFRLKSHKGLWRGEQYERLVILSDEALQWLAIARPVWSRLDSYSAAAIAAGLQGGPSVLRDSASSHLRSAGVALADVEACLGHVAPGEWRSYAAIPWHSLRKSMARITLRSGPLNAGSVGKVLSGIEMRSPRRPQRSLKKGM